MCGIIGYTGKNEAVPYLLYGLSKLQYRGYDSAGMALQTQEGIKVLKSKGTVQNLERRFDLKKYKSNCAIGHTRWATHGVPNDTNAHPHLSQTKLFAIVHNGIIENAKELREKLLKDGFTFKSDTDSEVIAHLLEQNYHNNSLLALSKTINELEGSFAVAVLCKEEKGRILAARKESPLIAAKSDEGLFIASDSSAILKYTNEVYTLDDGEIAVLYENEINFYTANANPISKEKEKINAKNEDTQKGNFEHFMLKEMNEQPKCIKDTFASSLQKTSIVFPQVKLSKSDLSSISDVHFVSCGSAYNAGLSGEYLIKEYVGINSYSHIASEFRYSKMCLSQNSLVVIISQSGETADTLAALRLAKKSEAKIISIVNVKNSSIAKESDNVIYTCAGTEVAVATTKAYSAQLISIYLLTVYLAEIKHTVEEDEKKALLEEIEKLESKSALCLENSKRIKSLSYIFSRARHIFFIGRHLDYPTACEAALKMKEISYIPCDAYPAGELKHGTISLIERGTLVVALCCQDSIFQKTLSNIKEVKARGGFVVAITSEKHKNHITEADEIITVPDCHNAFMPSLEVIPLQLLSYYTAKEKSCDIDKPRNLAKSVTVE